MQAVTAATTAELIKLKPIRRVLFILGRYVIAFFALRALQNYVISRHKSSRTKCAFHRVLITETAR